MPPAPGTPVTQAIDLSSSQGSDQDKDAASRGKAVEKPSKNAGPKPSVLPNSAPQVTQLEPKVQNEVSTRVTHTKALIDNRIRAEIEEFLTSEPKPFSWLTNNKDVSMSRWVQWLYEFDQEIQPGKLIVRVQAIVNEIQDDTLPTEEVETTGSLKNRTDVLVRGSVRHEERSDSQRRILYTHNFMAYEAFLCCLERFQDSRKAGGPYEKEIWLESTAKMLASKEQKLYSRHTVGQDKWRRNIGYGKTMNDLVCEFGQPGLFIIPWDKLCCIAQGWSRDSASAVIRGGIHHWMIPRCIRRWVLHRIQQPGLRECIKAFAVIIDNKVGQPYTINGIVPPRGQNFRVAECF